jgi:hypothetical protein
VRERREGGERERGRERERERERKKKKQREEQVLKLSDVKISIMFITC